MQKLRMQTKDYTEENARKLMELFPNVVTETIDSLGNVVRAIDKDKLEQEINAMVVAGPQQRYEFTWPDKKQAQIAARTPITKTLRPCREESVNFDATENLYIEGDNLEVLKLLQETYLGKIKMIYIDPPYNTGHDFVYNDHFAQGEDEYKANSGLYDEDGNYIATDANLDSNGRFHTDWLNMMYPRLRLAKNLLTEDGVIFISIDDNEVRNLKILCDEIFGEQNFVANFIRKTGSTRAMAKNYDIRHDYVLIYARNIECISLNEIDKDVNEYVNFDNDANGMWLSQDFTVRNGGFRYSIPSIDFSNEFIRNWQMSEDDVKRLMGGSGNDSFKEIYKRAIKDDVTGWYALGIFVFKGSDKIINKKKYAEQTSTLKNHTLYEDIGSNKAGSAIVADLLGMEKSPFTMPKPVELLHYLCFVGSKSNDIILDFFSGSATTAHAVMQLNGEDGGKRKFIMVQLPEKCDEKSEAAKAGYKNICEIGKERIRRAGKKIVGIVGSREQGVERSEESGKVQGVGSLAKGNVGCEEGLFAGGEIAQGRDVCPFGSAPESCSIYSQQYSGRKRQGKFKGVCEFSEHCPGIQGGSGNAVDVGGDVGLFAGSRSATFNGAAGGSGQDVDGNDSKTENSLTSTPYSLRTTPYLDIGFRVLKVDSSNMEDGFYVTPDKLEQRSLEGFANNIKEGRTGEDLLFQALLEMGLLPSNKIEVINVGGKQVYSVASNEGAEGYLLACFDRGLTEKEITEIAKMSPCYFVTADFCIGSDTLLSNFEQIFETHDVLYDKNNTIRMIGMR